MAGDGEKEKYLSEKKHATENYFWDRKYFWEWPNMLREEADFCQTLGAKVNN